MKYLIFSIVLLLPAAVVWAGNVAGPAKYYVNGEGRYLGVFHDAVDSDTGVVAFPVAVPTGAVRVPTSPPVSGMKWNADARAWAADPDYTPPLSPPTAMEILELLVSVGTITEEQKNSLLSGK